MTLKPVLFFHCVDANNLNAQSNNTKNILAHWDDIVLPAAVFHFNDPDPAVAANPNVRLIKLPPNRLWKARALAAGLQQFSGVYYPGFAGLLDDRTRRMRRALRLGGAVITTLEGLPGNAHSLEAEESRLSQMAGHRVFCQDVRHAEMTALNAMKANSDLIIAISPFLQRMAAQMWIGPAKTCVPLGVNLDIFHTRRRLKHGTNARVQVVSAGSLQLRKRPDIFLELARTHHDADFTWFGDGQLRGQLLEQAGAEGLTNVFFPGPVNSEVLSEAFRNADLFTLPSVSEGVPKVTQEAAACGLPVVCMAYYETFSVVDGVNGFQAGNDATYLGHMATLIGNAGLRAQMGAAGAEMAQGWSWDSLARSWQDAIRQAVLNDVARCTAG